MYQLRPFQEEAVQDLMKKTIDALQEPQYQTKILLEAPTGSGKTVMMAELLARIVDEIPLMPINAEQLSFIWIAPNTLHIQSYNSLKYLYSDSNKLTCVNLDEMGTNPVLNHRELLFINWSTVDKERNIWRRENETNTNLETLIENTRLSGAKIILVIDEAHLSAFSGQQAIAVRALIKADAEIYVTATPNFERPQRSVSVTRRRVVDEQMIKKGVRFNIGLRPEDQNGENVHIHLLRTAFKKKQEMQELYDKELGRGVLNPLILIQLPSDNTVLTDEDRTIRETLESLLLAEYDISTQNGRLAVWLSGERDKDGLEEMNGLQDVLIFKQAIAQGWDCPRASILVNYRVIGSTTFGLQTVGRILRMPHQKHYTHDALNYGYVYSNIPTNQIQFVPSDSDYFDWQISHRKNNSTMNFDVLSKDIIVNDRPTPGVLTSAFDKIFYKVMEERYDLKPIPEADLLMQDDLSLLNETKERNQKNLAQRFWEFTIDSNQVKIVTDFEVKPEVERSNLIDGGVTRYFALTPAQYSIAFDKFCYDQITRLNRSKSWKKLRQTLIQFAEYYLSMFETDTIRLFLYPQNKEYLQQDIVTALERFDIWQKEKGNVNRRVVSDNWEVPVARYYSEKYNRFDIESHAMEPFYEYQGVSAPELAFKEYLQRNENLIEWWYKNGDSGKEHFSVHYRSELGEVRLFYVDFVVKLKSSVICLFDTKTKRSDRDAPQKHNALLDYIEKENTEHIDRQLIGGILIPEGNQGITNFRYPKFRITDTNDLTGWEFINLSELR
jgi:type III restriction enzyme